MPIIYRLLARRAARRRSRHGRAASAASKAADYPLAFRPDPSEPVDVIQAADELEKA
jgi:hypothetical protein